MNDFSDMKFPFFINANSRLLSKDIYPYKKFVDGGGISPAELNGFQTKK